MKCLSIRQPYAFAIVMGYKPVENRDWKTPFRGRVLIHAGLKEERDDLDGVLRQVAAQTGRSIGDVTDEYFAHRHLGAIVGAATITDIVTAMESQWFYGPYGFVLAEATACRPI